MEVTFKKEAAYKYIDGIGFLHGNMRRDMDMGASAYKECETKHAMMIATCLEEETRARNHIADAEADISRANNMISQAYAAYDSDDENSSVDYGLLSDGQALLSQATAELEKAESDLARASGCKMQIEGIWAQYSGMLSSSMAVANDRFNESLRLGNAAENGLQMYAGYMDQAQGTLYDTSGIPAVGGSVGSIPSAAGSREIGSVGIVAPEQVVTREPGAGHGVLAGAAATAGIALAIGGVNRTFSNNKAGVAKAYKEALKSGDKELAGQLKSTYDRMPVDGILSEDEMKSIAKPMRSEADRRWNEEYFPLIEANIRSSVDRYFDGYIAPEKVDDSIRQLQFMDQFELSRRYGAGFQNGTLGFNDGETSNIAHDIKGRAWDTKVGDHFVQGSSGGNINYAFVTAVHENLHMMSANDEDGGIRRRGLMVGNDEGSRAMNEAFTEYFTYLSCGGENPSGGLYPGEYSGYHDIMAQMPKLEKAVGRDCMMEAYFHNNPAAVRGQVDGLIGTGAWDDMCRRSYNYLYNNKSGAADPVLDQYFDRLGSIL